MIKATRVFLFYFSVENWSTHCPVLDYAEDHTLLGQVDLFLVGGNRLSPTLFVLLGSMCPHGHPVLPTLRQ